MGLFLSIICKSSPRIVTAQPMNGSLILEILEKYSVNCVFMGTVYISEILELFKTKTYDLSKLMVLKTTGSPLPSKTRETFKQYYPRVIILTAYGMTDIGGGITFTMGNSAKPKTVGQLIPGATMKVKSYYIC